MFKKIIGDAFDTTRERAELTNELCEHLRQLGVNATAVDPRTIEEVEGRDAYGLAKIEDRNIDLVEINSFVDGDRKRSYYCTYHTRVNVEGLGNMLDVEGEPTKKGFIRKDVVDYQWKGGDLAQRLNADADLKNMLITAQADKIHVTSSTTFYARALHGTAVIRYGSSTWGGAWKKRSFPTREAFDISDRIASHIRSIKDARS